MNSKKKGLFHLVISDFRKRAKCDGKKRIYPYFFTLLFNQPLLGVLIYRISHFFYSKKLYFLAKMGPVLSQNLCCMGIDPRAEIGESFCVVHPFGVVIFGSTVIGNNVTIYQGVTITIGPRWGMKPEDKVIINDDVVIYSGAVIAGNIIIGKNCKIGANTTIRKSLPDNSVAIAPEPRLLTRIYR